jgi:tRNA-2-methylthio-N6-dimethylallyladenosine synthase
LINKEKSLERLEIIQQKLFNNQINMNKKIEDTTIKVLVENRTDDKSKLFARSEYMTSVLFNGSDDLIGKIVKVKVKNSNRNTLFGEAMEQSNQKVA